MIETSSPDRVVYPETSTTKAEVVGHYSAVAARMLRHLRDRPLTLERFPRGVAAKGFMQKNASEYFPDYIGRYEVARSEGTTTHPVVTDTAGIEYLANQNTITFHMPTTTCTDYEHPDRLIIDLDPPEQPGAAIHDAAWATKELLDELGVSSLPTATGSKGFHITAVIESDLAVPEVDELGQLVAALLAYRHPEMLTTEFRKANRGERIFCDWLRNRWGATSVAPWSLRPRSRPTVAVPVRWDQLDDIAPDGFELGSLPEADPLAEAPADSNDLRGALAKLEEMAAEAGVEIEPFDRFRS